MPAFVLYGSDNDSYAFIAYPLLKKSQRIHQKLVPEMSGASRPGILRCGACGGLTSKWNEPLSNIVLKKRGLDLSTTYDGLLIASQRFKSIYDANQLSGLVFRQLPDDRDFFAIGASKVVEFDAERRKTRFITPCAQCGQFDSVVGATPVFLKAGNEVEDSEFVRTDLEFGSGDEKHPLLLCGQVVAESLAKRKLTGLELLPIKEGGENAAI